MAHYFSFSLTSALTYLVVLPILLLVHCTRIVGHNHVNWGHFMGVGRCYLCCLGCTVLPDLAPWLAHTPLLDSSSQISPKLSFAPCLQMTPPTDLLPASQSSWKLSGSFTHPLKYLCLQVWVLSPFFADRGKKCFSFSTNSLPPPHLDTTPTLLSSGTFCYSFIALIVKLFLPG